MIPFRFQLPLRSRVGNWRVAEQARLKLLPRPTQHAVLLSKPAEPPRQLLAGTYVNLSIHTAPVCLLEIMGIYDANLIDSVPAGDFRFGRHVYEHLEQREGVVLTALHSTQSEADADTASRAGFTVAGHLEFGRDVSLPDGTQGRTRTTLALLPDAKFPRLSFFLCQQHRPEFIYVQEWLQHPNKVNGIRAVNIVAQRKHHKTLRQRLGKLYDGAQDIENGLHCQTANGIMRIQEPETFMKNTGLHPMPS